MKKFINNTRGSFIVDQKILTILILALILCYFGLFAEGLRFILSWEVGFFISLLNFFLFNVYFFLVIIIFLCKKFILNFVKKSDSVLFLKYKKNNNIIKRYYYISMLLLINPFFESLKKGNFLTKKTIFNIYKSNVKKSNNEVNISFKNFYKISSKSMNHYGQINGMKFYNENSLDINVFTTYTNGDFHEISLDIIESSKFEKLDLDNPILPTLKVDLKILDLEVNKNLVFPNQSLVKTYIPDNLKVSVNNNDIQEFDLKKAIEIKSNKEKVMEILELKNYEFIDKNKQLYLVPQKDIIKQGEIIVSISFENAEKVNLEKVVVIGETVIKKEEELENYVNISPKLKEEYLKNSYEYLKYNKCLKKD